MSQSMTLLAGKPGLISAAWQSLSDRDSGNREKRQRDASHRHSDTPGAACQTAGNVVSMASRRPSRP